ncbi:hypothetical protein GQ53DRAFT_827286 [Thozetella sp. PMI_491]|nr:hypothetical protein GQ53DRAFT_827286 [Thozetella sp. PMI_491]
MALTSRLTLTGPPEADPEDFLSSSLGVIFPDDVTNQHGDADHGLAYTSPHLPKPLCISLADPVADEDRRLFSHFLWNASLLLAELVETGTLGLLPEPPSGHGTQEPLSAPVSEFNVAGLTTIELGAGTALPSLLSALLGARRVVITDYPAPPVMKTLQENVALNVKPGHSPLGQIAVDGVHVEGHSWGELSTPLAQENHHAFDRVFVADCLWMPWQHKNLQRSIEWFLGEGEAARAWVVAGFHTGREKMRGFFDSEALTAVGLEVEKIWERDCNGEERPWVWDGGIEDVSVRKRWLVVAVLRRRAATSSGARDDETPENGTP